jgi:D-alanyl-D-alanine carboxypeptidase
VDKASFSKKPKKVPSRSLDDIPEALRDNRKVIPRRRFKSVVIISSLVGLGVIGAISLLWSLNASPPSKVSQSAVTVSPVPPTSDRPSNENVLLGHFAYPEASPKDLQPISSDRRFKLRKAAAQQFNAMSASARASGVVLVPISGFRTVKDQQHLFFDVKAERGQTATKRAEVSAPPGYSEHHTGYAVDIGDGNTPATNLSTKFETTRAYKWLSVNAARYSFELSFPKNNRQGVSYEPWHWRYVGDRDSLETFYKAQNLKSRPTP